MAQEKEIIIAGAAIIDVLVQGAQEDVFLTGSSPAENITMGVGGDALNEATVLGRLGAPVRLLTVLGCDEGAATIRRHCEKANIRLQAAERTDVPTGINVVLVKKDGQRNFLTNPHGTLRSLSLDDIPFPLPESGSILCFASIFVFPRWHQRELKLLFSHAKELGMIVCADMTKCKNREIVDDLKEALAYVDYLFPNEEEARLVTGKDTPEEMADVFLQAGVKTVVIKCGARGCYICSRKDAMWIEAVKDVTCVDTTGAGDSFAAGFLYGLWRGLSLRDCGCLANVCGALSVGKLGATEGIENLRQALLLAQKTYG